MTGQETLALARSAAEAVRALNHATRPGVAHADLGLGVTDVYDLLGELALLTGRVPQLLTQLQDLVDDLVETGQVRVIDGEHQGDPVAAAVTCGHWLTGAAGAAHQVASRVDAAQQALTWAADSAGT